VTEHFLTGRGIYYRCNVRDQGRRTLVFVHGVSGSSSAWRAYEGQFEHRYNLVSYDLRGHGRSRKYARLADYAVEHFVDDLTILLDHLAIQQCVIVGHSFAAVWLLEFLRVSAARVEAIALLSPDYDVGRSRKAKILGALLRPVGLLDYLPYRPRNGGHVDYTRYPMSGDWNARRMLADIRNTTLRVYLYCSRSIYTVKAESFLPRIGVPVLLVHGDRDSIFPVENSRSMACRIPRARVVVLEGADHILVLNHPDAVTRALDEFLRETDSRTSPSPSGPETHTNIRESNQHDGGERELDAAKRRRDGLDRATKIVARREQHRILESRDPNHVPNEPVDRNRDDAGDDEKQRRQTPRHLADEHRLPAVTTPPIPDAFDVRFADTETPKQCRAQLAGAGPSAEHVVGAIDRDVFHDEEATRDQRVEIAERGERPDGKGGHRSFNDRQWDRNPVAIPEERGKQ
jgi:pimeloyl-ACP methyl ester carboxylesterase